MSDKKLTEQIKSRAKTKEKEKVVNFISTNSTILDLICGGGFPDNGVINIVGDKSSGKTLLTIEFLASAKRTFKDKLKIIYDDCEAGFHFDTKRLYGFKLYDSEYSFSKTVEDLEYNITRELKKLKGDERLIYVVDSLDAVGSEDEKERSKKLYEAKSKGKTLEKGTYGMSKQKQLGVTFRNIADELKKKKALLIIISQVRYNIGVMFGEKYTVSGGKALEFYAAIRLYLAECEKKKKKVKGIEKVYGITIKVKTKKNKVGLPFRDGFIDVLFDYGVDDIMSNICYLYNLRTDTGKLKSKKDRKDTLVEWEDKEYTIEELIEHIENKNLERKLKKKVMDKWYKIEEEISSKDRKRKY
jgi:RecA/RadA recombinase